MPLLPRSIGKGHFLHMQIAVKYCVFFEAIDVKSLHTSQIFSNFAVANSESHITEIDGAPQSIEKTPTSGKARARQR